MEKKKYKKPNITNKEYEGKGLVPIAAAAALVGAFVAGRAATKMFDSRGNFSQYKTLRKVVNSYE